MFSNDLSKVIQDVISDEKIFKDIANNTIEEITNQAYDKVVSKCISVNLSNHIGEIRKEISGNTGSISSNDAAIVFKELGTGVVGSRNPHPDPQGMFEGWKYDYNSHGELGWYYPKEDGTYGWTKGLPANAMFFNTYNEMLNETDKILNASLNNIK